MASWGEKTGVAHLLEEPMCGLRSEGQQGQVADPVLREEGDKGTETQKQGAWRGTRRACRGCGHTM